MEDPGRIIEATSLGLAKSHFVTDWATYYPAVSDKSRTERLKNAGKITGDTFYYALFAR